MAGTVAVVTDSTAFLAPDLAGSHGIRVVPLQTTARAMARLEGLAVERAVAAAGAPVDVALQHLGRGARAAELAQHLSGRIPGLRSMHISEVRPVIAVHTGPGMLGVVVAPD